MKGIIKYNRKFYKKVRTTTNDIKKGDLIKLECKRKSDYFKYNGIYIVADNWRCIHIKNYDGKGMTLCLKLGYNVSYGDFSILKEVQRKIKTLPMPPKEEELCGYTL
jgi:hypothetical protein